LAKKCKNTRRIGRLIEFLLRLRMETRRRGFVRGEMAEREDRR
jgi:hypothetical protein